MMSRVILLLYSLAHLQLMSSLAFSHPLTRNTATALRHTSTTTKFIHHHHHHQRWLSIRGGGQQQQEEDIMTTSSSPQQIQEENSSQATSTAKQSGFQIPFVTTALISFGKLYSQYLELYPIRTKSITACGIFAISDWLAQRFEQSSSSKEEKQNKQSFDKKRTLAAALVGLLYFGPAAHYWYENIFKLFPSTNLISTLQKATMGQLFFGPSFTIIFFGTALLQSGNFTLKNWYYKIKNDLFQAWLAGVGYWPLVDLISYSLIPPRWIPLFINIASLIWNVYLSFVANRKASTSGKTATA